MLASKPLTVILYPIANVKEINNKFLKICLITPILHAKCTLGILGYYAKGNELYVGVVHWVITIFPVF